MRQAKKNYEGGKEEERRTIETKKERKLKENKENGKDGIGERKRE